MKNQAIVLKSIEAMSPETFRAWISDVAKATGMSELDVSILEPFDSHRAKLYGKPLIPKTTAKISRKKKISLENLKEATLLILRQEGSPIRSTDLWKKLADAGIHTHSKSRAELRKLITEEGCAEIVGSTSQTTYRLNNVQKREESGTESSRTGCENEESRSNEGPKEKTTGE